MKQASFCYVEKPEDPSLVLGVWSPKHLGWSMPGGKVEEGEHPMTCALRELHEETGVCGMGPRMIFKAPGSADPDFEVLVYRVVLAPFDMPRTCEIGAEVKWVPPSFLCASRTLGPFYQQFFRQVFGSLPG